MFVMPRKVTVNFAWQDVVDLLHDDEDEVEERPKRRGRDDRSGLCGSAGGDPVHDHGVGVDLGVEDPAGVVAEVGDEDAFGVEGFADGLRAVERLEQPNDRGREEVVHHNDEGAHDVASNREVLSLVLAVAAAPRAAAAPAAPAGHVARHAGRDGRDVDGHSHECVGERSGDQSRCGADDDGDGDVCDDDDDNDGVSDMYDECPLLHRRHYNRRMRCVNDRDEDFVFDHVDNCVNVSNPLQGDADRDGLGDLCDVDADGNGIADRAEWAPVVHEPAQPADRLNQNRVDESGSAAGRPPTG